MSVCTSTQLRWFGVFAPLAAVAVLMSATYKPAHGERDMRDDQRWDWSASHANPLHCLLQQAGDRYDLVLSRDHRAPGVVTISVSRDRKPVYEWTGHAYSVFQIVGDRLYYADYSTSSSGGAVAAVDLANGKTLWREPLQALGPIEHSKYFNRLNLAADEASVRVTGNESAGRYIEVKDAATGRTIANRQLPAEAADGA